MIKRRQLLQLSAAALVAGPSLRLRAETASGASAPKSPIQRLIPSSGEALPVMGMGTSRTFDTDANPESLANLSAVMQALFAGGGTVIDSSPMYGQAESRVGDVLRAMPARPPLFAATKVWTTGRQQGIAQMQESARRMDVKTFDLIAVHNLQDWQTQLETLKAWKEEGKVRYIGITTSHGRDHEAFIDIMRTQPVDFAQFSYNIEDRTAEKELLPVAADRGIATMINRPYQRGALFNKSRGKPLPPLAAELDCTSWGQFYLKFIIGHPAVTSVIPATASAKHMVDNMQANYGRVPDPTQRAEMLRLFEQL
ncbi:MAG: aldo/keto reductase [Halieaceae bacterium]|nr:aldo/keto reductase [Halieaceae bacterium]